MDEAGFVADFSSVSNPFTVGALTAATFSGYNGTGFSSGSGIPPGCGGMCQSHNNQPISLLGSDGNSYLLALGNRDTGPTPAATAQLVRRQAFFPSDDDYFSRLFEIT
jgi:hypothetical protein